MTFTYDIDNLDGDLNRIRLEIGDTDEKRQLLQDEEIVQIVTEQSSFFVQVAKCCYLIASKFAGKASTIALGSFRESRQDVYNRYVEMAKQYAAKVSPIWAGSIEADFKRETKADTSLVMSRIKRGMHDNV